MASGQPEDFWLFGYGSLIWKPPPHFGEYFRIGLTLGVEVFLSEDHRGTPDAPGRVATLIQRSFWETLDDPQRQTEDDHVWGVAYHIIPSKVKEVKEYLDIREMYHSSVEGLCSDR
ncbi:hypothetical protein LTR40_004536 [Exophiala xenobiotica]|nr:hypothetical protein LTR40_004536 [Exophiala xenobiotica]